MSVSAGTYHVTYLGEDLGEVEMTFENERCAELEIVAGYRRSAEILTIPIRRHIDVERFLLGPILPRKHWVRDRDWTQRQATRSRRKSSRR